MMYSAFFLLLSFLLSPHTAYSAITNTTDYLIIPAGESYTLSGTHSYINSIQIDGTLYITPYNGTQGTGSLELSAPVITIGSAGRIDGTSRGYRGGNGTTLADGEGPGGGKYARMGGGGGYGSKGGEGTYNTWDPVGYGGSQYGSITSPLGPGSGGGVGEGRAGGGGGGAEIRILSSGTFTNNGVITSNGGDAAYGGGGSGGTILINVNEITGTGSMTANGGNSQGGGGAGGRIAIYYQNDTYTGSITAFGNSNPNQTFTGAWRRGGAGTIYKKSLSDNSNELIIDNGSKRGETTILEGGFGRITARNTGFCQSTSTLSAGQLSVTANGGFYNTGACAAESMSLGTGGEVYCKSGSFQITELANINDGGILYVDAPLNVKDLKVFSGGIITHTARAAGFELNASGDMDIETGGKIDVAGKGFRGGDGITLSDGEGPGGGKYAPYAGGGGYGSAGGTGMINTWSPIGTGGSQYGSITEPSEMGSGGGVGEGRSAGGAGGGKIKLSVAYTLKVDGAIIANGINGGDGGGGGGSGGSIYITADEITGTGSISADGGNKSSNCSSGGGSGGRIALYYQTNSFTGALSAYGKGAQSDVRCTGGAGTIFKKSAAQNFGEVFVRGEGRPGAPTYIFGEFDSVNSSRQGLAVSTQTLTTGSLNITEGGVFINSGTIHMSDLALTTGASFYLHNGSCSIDDEAQVSQGGRWFVNIPVSASRIRILDGGMITHSEGDPDFALIVAGSMDVETGGKIDVDGKGFAGGTFSTRNGEGPGGGKYGAHGGGAGYGANGGTPGARAGYDVGSGGESYGSIVEPNNFGSGGGCVYLIGGINGGNGGGKIKLSVSGTLKIDGAITANGTEGGYGDIYGAGGGSGGSIFITANEITGTGSISTNGGNSGYNNQSDGGGGAGGRIALYYQTNNFAGTISAYGKGSPNSADRRGGAGTIFKKFAAQSLGELIIESNGKIGAPACIFGAFNSITAAKQSVVKSTDNLTTGSLTVTEGGVFINSGTIHMSDLALTTGASFYLNNGSCSIDDEVQVSLGGRWFVNIPVSASRVRILDGGMITHSEGDPDFALTVSGNMDIESGGSLNVNGKGFPGDSGPGYGKYGAYGGGGGYGGKGGTGASKPGFETGIGGETYGSITEPNELGSGGGRCYLVGGVVGGAGGGKVKLIVSGSLTNNGLITSDGGQGAGGEYAGGGGSGGSIYIFADTLSGSGQITANGGKPGNSAAGGGGGGRIAVYCRNLQYTGNVTADRMTGGQAAAENGTIIKPVQDPDSPVNMANSAINYVQNTNLSETVSGNSFNMSLNVSGGLSGSVSLSNGVHAMIKTGAFASKGFLRADWSGQLEGVSHSGKIKAMAYIDAKDNKLFVRGSVEGTVSGIIEGAFAESLPQSGTYDQFSGTWTFRYPRGDGQYSCGKSFLDGTASYLGYTEYQNTSLDYIQTSAAGEISGSYTGKLDTVLTNVWISDTDCPYNGEGFGLFSYRTATDDGQGWFYSRSVTSGEAELSGMIGRPLVGYLQGVLINKETEKKLWLIISRLDIGEEPKAELQVDIFTPENVSPGQTITYTLRVRNVGLVPADNIKVLLSLPLEARFLAASGDYCYMNGAESDFVKYPTPEQGPESVSWLMPAVPAKSTYFYNVQAKTLWGLGSGQNLDAEAGVYSYDPNYFER